MVRFCKLSLLVPCFRWIRTRTIPLTVLSEKKNFPEIVLSYIKILSEHLANQIAAGEVIERPASVVKEFFENSIDAAARHVSIQIEGDGTRLIRVVDDGQGMDEDDVLLCLERHATSKLFDSTTGVDQLSGIVTLGFRGEAIPSVASVSRFAITSRPEEAALGSRIEVKYGRVMKIHETGCSRGTVMEVRDLFGNVPASKKFLKTKRTELGHIEDVVKSYCLALPQLGVTYQVDDRVIFDLPAETDSLGQRVRWFLNRSKSEPLLKVDSAGLVDIEKGAEASPLDRVTGFFLPPDESYGPTAKLKLFVNNRVVRDRMIVHAIHDGLAGFLMKGRGAAGVLFLTIDPEFVDVNVHPTKQEIRFHASSRIHKHISLVVRQAIVSYQDDMRFSLFGSPVGDLNDRPTASSKPLSNIGRQSVVFEESNSSEPIVAEPEGNYSTGDIPWPAPGRKEYRSSAEGHDIQKADLPWDKSLPAKPERVQAEGVKIDRLQPLGQFMDLYILCETADDAGRSLVVIDQHAAHERIVFETLKKQFDAQKVASQALLFPKLMDFSLDQVQVVIKYWQEIVRLGIDLEEFGEQSYIVKAVPAILAHLSPEEILSAVVEQFQDVDKAESGRKVNAGSRIDDVLSSIACKAAVKAGHPLKREEIDDLLRQMHEADVFSHCPHGRPVFKTFSNAEIRRWFHRT